MSNAVLQARSKSDRVARAAPPAWRGATALFVVALGVAGALLGAATLLTTWTGGAGPASPWILWLLGASLTISATLCGLMARALWRTARTRTRPESGARLQGRFVATFSAAAIAPAIVVALFLGALLSRGVEQWFSERLKTTVDNAASFARSYVNAATDEIHDEVLPMAADLNGAAAALQADREGYGRYLLRQAVLRSFPAAYVINRSGAPLAAAEATRAPPFERPPPSAFADADAGAVWIRPYVEANIFRALYRLDGYDEAYLYVARFADEGILARLRVAEQAVSDYREAESRRARLQMVFAVAYLTSVLLVLAGTMRLAMATAARFAGPVARLAHAARSVAAGDLAVRVSASEERDELDALARAFNRMTAQLEAQRQDLVSARQEAEGRTRFIGAVLSGVSAGVIGVSADGRITLANPIAADLLGAPGDQLEGRSLVAVCPEFEEALAFPVGAPRRIDLTVGASTVHLLVRRSEEPDGGAVLTFDDVTKLIAAQRHEAWKDVARRIAHEIKNPLTPIQLSAERLQRKYADEIASDPETFRRCTDTILRQVADIGRMVDEFSAFARMPTARAEPLDAAELCREVAFAQRLAFPDTAFEIEGGDAPTPIVGDERLLSQALTNILKNAGEAVMARRALEGEPKLGHVAIRLEARDEVLSIEVQDNGVGLPEHDRARLLEPYVTTRARGAGLGLAIVRRVIEDHGGAIEMTDAPGPMPGALVRLTLPRGGVTSQAGAQGREIA